MDGKRYRVAQWGTGNVGLYALRSIIEHPRFDLVGCRVYSEEKAGRDAGELCGLPLTGVIATQDVEAIIAAKPDCVVYMADRSEMDVLERLLASGINVATARFEFNNRASMPAELRQRFEAACAKGGTSIYCSGSTPGWFTEVMPLVLSAIQRRYECITLTDYADMASRNSPDMLFNVLPFGRDPATVDPGAGGTNVSSPPTISMVAAALGLPVDEVRTRREFAVARETFAIPAGPVQKGTIAAMRMAIEGVRGGKVVMRRNSIWYLTRDIEPAWDLRDTGLHYRVEGDLPLDVMFTIPVSAEEYPKVSPALTANPVVNAVPYVVDAAPGILQTDELPIVVGKFA
ncbi:MAG TPA: dihydrodipicolinate reductase [Novosphingobium sp.]